MVDQKIELRKQQEQLQLEREQLKQAQKNYEELMKKGKDDQDHSRVRQCTHIKSPSDSTIYTHNL